MAYVLTLEWSRCPDGVEVVPGEQEGRLRYRSEKRETYRRRLAEPDDLIVTEFINTWRTPRDDGFLQADEVAALASFVERYGFPHDWHNAPDGEMTIGDVIKVRDDLVNLWDAYDEHPLAAVREFQTMSDRIISSLQPSLSIRHGHPRLTLPVSTPFAFMLMESAMVISGGCAVHHCQQCGSVFVSGGGTGRRSSALYCSNKCRVAAQRARKEKI